MENVLILILTPIWNVMDDTIKESFVSFDEFMEEVKLTMDWGL